MATSGGKCFYWAIFLCIAVGGILIWYKYFRKAEAKVQPETSIKEEIKNLPKAIFTIDEACGLLYYDSDDRAGVMHDRAYTKKEIKGGGSMIYDFNLTGGKSYYSPEGYITFIKNADFYSITFSDKNEYQKFFLHRSPNIKITRDNGKCDSLLALTNYCFACAEGFKEYAGGYRITFAKNEKMAVSQNIPLPVNPKLQQPKKAKVEKQKVSPTPKPKIYGERGG